jgi:hypothetical protein
MAKYVLRPQKLGNYCALREGLMWIAFDRFPEYSTQDILDKYTATYLKLFEDGAIDEFMRYFFDNILPNLNDIDGNKITDNYEETDENYDIMDEYAEVFYHKLFVKLREQKIALFGITRNSKDNSYPPDDKICFERIETEEIIYDFIDWQNNWIRDPDNNPENDHYYSELFIPIEDLLREFPIKNEHFIKVQELENVYLLDDSDTSKISDIKLRGRKPVLSEDGLLAVKRFCKDFIETNPNGINKVIIYACIDWLKQKLDVWLPFSTVRDYVTPVINETKNKTKNKDVKSEN